MLAVFRQFRQGAADALAHAWASRLTTSEEVIDWLRSTGPDKLAALTLGMMMWRRSSNRLKN